MDQKRIRELEQKISTDYGNTTGVAVLKEGKLVYEKYFKGCTRESQVHVYSVTKSIISILIGIAVDRGYIQSVDQKVLDFFPGYIVRKRENTIQNITVKDMLTMTAPYKYRFFAPYVKYFTSEDWVKFSLDLLGGRGKIGTFRYAPLIGPDIFSGILVKATGQSVFEFADENLFSPLEIHVDGDLMFKSKEEQLAFNESIDTSGWVRDSLGIHTAGWGLTLSPMDMVKIGQLYLNKGILFTVPSAARFTGGLHGITVENIPPCGGAVPVWNMDQQPVTHQLFRSKICRQRWCRRSTIHLATGKT